MLNQLKLILDELVRIWRGRYQPMQLYLWAGFSLPAQASFFLICMGDSAGAGYRLRVMPRPDLLMNLKKGYLLKKLLLKWANEKCKNFNIYNVVLFWKNKEKHLEISSFYPCVPKIMIRWCTVPEIWCMMDGEMDNWTEKVTYRGGCPT